ncbi:anti-sigma factor, partial [Paenibacillus sp. TAF58]
MNCQEVMEFMQRQLDGDLDAKEEDELHAHLMHCLDCAQMFERLQRLSDELTQLPKVVPPYSLVDAIMPQLADIDRHAAASITDKVAVFGTNASQRTSVQPPKLPWTRRLGLQ